MGQDVMAWDPIVGWHGGLWGAAGVRIELHPSQKVSV